MNQSTEVFIIGWIATVLTIVMYAPQTYKAIKTRNVEGLSKLTFLMVAMGSIFWTWFGVNIGSWQAWSANAVVLLLMLPIIYFLFRSKVVAFKDDVKKSNYIIQHFKSQKFFIISLIVILINFIATLILLALGDFINSTSALVMSILGGLGISVPFLPQTFKTIKTKNTSAISIYSTITIVFANLFWVLYYTLWMVDDLEASKLVSMLFSALGMITSSALAFVYIKYKK